MRKAHKSQYTEIEYAEMKKNDLYVPTLAFCKRIIRTNHDNGNNFYFQSA